MSADISTAWELDSPRVWITDAAGTLALNATDADGVQWWAEVVEGWDDSPQITAARSEAALDDRTWFGRPLASAREVAITGTLVGADRTAVALAKRRLSALLTAGDRTGLMAVENELGTLTLPVHLDGSTKVRHIADTVVQFQITLVGRSAWRAGPETTVSVPLALSSSTGVRFDFVRFDPTISFTTSTSPTGTAVLPNAGTIEAWPVLTLRGPFTTPYVQDMRTGDSFALQTTLSDGSTAIVDMSARTVRIDGTSRRDLVAAGSSWLPVPPGGTTWRVRSSGTAGTATVTYSPRYP